MKHRRSREVARVRIPTNQAPLFHLPGPHGGWYVSLLFGHRFSVDVPMPELRKLLVGSRGEVIIARRLTYEEARFLETKRSNSDSDVHASLISKEEERFRRPRFRRSRRGDRPSEPTDRPIESTKGGT